jgi:hypothetical protein
METESKQADRAYKAMWFNRGVLILETLLLLLFFSGSLTLERAGYASPIFMLGMLLGPMVHLPLSIAIDSSARHRDESNSHMACAIIFLAIFLIVCSACGITDGY